ncbi:MAG: FIST N-terminal domain-containing protein [Thermoleophilia bacterium]
MDSQNGIRIAQSCALDPREAAQEFFAAVAQPDMTLVIFFCSSEYDRDELAAEMSRLFANVLVVGCTTAGEIGPAGYRDHSLAGVSFAGNACTAVSGRIEHLRQFEIADGQALAEDLLHRLASGAARSSGESSFGFLLVDGLSVREELVAHALQGALGEIPVIGGSAGDSLDFGSTYIYSDGCFFSDSAVLVLASTPLPFKTFKTQHFVPTNERLVVTEADPAERIVKEINGLPAAEEYARILGVPASDLDPIHFAASPVVVLIDGANYVRSIQKSNPDGSLTFFSAIEEGLVLRVAQGVGLVANLEMALSQVGAEIGPPQLILVCDCILRKLEIVQSGLTDRVSAILRRNNAVGLNTYGEQFCGVHVNQTLTGIAFGSGPAEADGA